MNPFNRDIGIHQGRIASATAPEGACVYELGHALLQDANIAVGNYHEVSQVITIGAQTKLLRMHIRIVTPPGLPLDAAWEVSIALNGTKRVSRRLRTSKRALVLDDVCISVFGANRSPLTDLLAVRLELI